MIFSKLVTLSEENTDLDLYFISFSPSRHVGNSWTVDRHGPRRRGFVESRSRRDGVRGVMSVK